MMWARVIAAALGLSLLVSGILAVLRRKTKASPEGEVERVYQGAASVLLGMLWVILGVGIILAVLGVGSSGLLGYLQKIGSIFLGM